MNKKAFVYIIIAGILWGTSGIFVHYLSPYGFTAFQMTGVRAIVSFLCIALYACIGNRRAFCIRLPQLLLFAGIGASLFFTAGCYYLSMQMTSVSTAVILMYLSPIYVTVFSALFLGEILTKRKLVAIAAMLIGCCLVSGIIGGLNFDAMGILVGLLSGVSYAAYSILTKIAMQKRIEPIAATLYGFLFMSLISLFVLEPSRLVTSIGTAPALTLPLLLGLGVFTFVVPYFLYTLAIKELSAGVASSLGIIEPMCATLFGVLLFREPMDIFSALGIVLILGATCWIGKAESTATNQKS